MPRPEDLDTLLGTPHPAPDDAPEPSLEHSGFGHPQLLPSEEILALRTIHERFARSLARKLSTELICDLSLRIDSIVPLTYTDFLHLLPSPAVLSVIDVPTLDGSIAIELHPSIAFAFIDRLLGGSGTSISEARALTVIEQNLLERILAKCCGELGALWSPVLPLSFQLRSIEANPELAPIVEPNEMVIRIAFEIRMNEISGNLNLCLPYIVMEPAFQRMRRGGAAPRSVEHADAPSQSIFGDSLETPVSLEVDLAQVEFSLRELLDLRAGDVLTLSPLSESGAAASLQGVAQLEGKPGRSRGRRAFQVVSKRPGGARAEENLP
jgi:flagellar motor switch protein FliM